jgi:hypothetical protein
MKCPQGCGATQTAKKLPLHCERDCPRRSVPCGLGCGERILALKQHLHERSCDMRLVCCSLCGRHVPAKQLGQHKISDCTGKRVPCQFAERGCSMVLPRKDLQAHATGQCEYRDIYCRVGCGKLIEAQQLLYHERRVCPERRVNCKWKCPEFLKAYQKEEHERTCDRKPVKGT